MPEQFDVAVSFPGVFEMRELSLVDFSGAVGSTYLVQAEDCQLNFTLEMAVELDPSVRAAGSFRLEFRGPAEPVLEQATHRFHQGDEVFDIFIVPVARDANGTLYEAIFN